MIGDAPFGVSFNISNSSPNSTIATACCLHWEEAKTPDSSARCAIFLSSRSQALKPLSSPGADLNAHFAAAATKARLLSQILFHLVVGGRAKLIAMCTGMHGNWSSDPEEGICIPPPSQAVSNTGNAYLKWHCGSMVHDPSLWEGYLYPAPIPGGSCQPCLG